MNIEQRWTCSRCGIFFARFSDFAQHDFSNHYEPDPDLVSRIEDMIQRIKNRDLSTKTPD